MDGLYYDEKKTFQINLSSANWSTGDLHEIFGVIGNFLNDVDWITETENSLLLIEFKDYSKGEHRIDDKEKYYQNILSKYYGSAYFLFACGKKKPMDFILIVNSPLMDTVIGKRAEASIKKRLPFILQNNPEIPNQLINHFWILSISDWNDRYPMFPLQQC